MQNRLARDSQRPGSWAPLARRGWPSGLRYGYARIFRLSLSFSRLSTFVSHAPPHAPAQLSILVVLLSCDVDPQVDRASMCCGRVVRRNHAEPCLRAVVRDHRHALLPLRNCRHFVDSRWNRALPTSFVAILPSSLSSRSARSIGPQRRGSVGRRLPLMSFCSRDYLR